MKTRTAYYQADSQLLANMIWNEESDIYSKHGNNQALAKAAMRTVAWVAKHDKDATGQSWQWVIEQSKYQGYGGREPIQEVSRQWRTAPDVVTWYDALEIANDIVTGIDTTDPVGNARHFINMDPTKLKAHPKTQL